MTSNEVGAGLALASYHAAAVEPLLKQAGFKLARSLPGVAVILDIGALSNDAYRGYNEYQGCLTGE